MAVYEFQGLSKQNRALSGTIEAGDHDEAIDNLREMGLDVTDVAAAPKRSTGRISRDEFLYFNQQLATVAAAGIPLDRGLRDLAADLTSRSLRRTIEAIADDIEKGTPADQAFAKYEKQFPVLYANIFKAGVTTGQLAETLAGLNRHLRLAHHTRHMIWEAVSYPAVVLIAAAIIVSLVLRFLIPGFEEMFLDFDTRLPGLTVLIIGISKHIGAAWLAMGILVGIVAAGYVMLGRTRAGRRMIESSVLALPVLGRLYRNSLLARLAHGLATSISAGVPLPTALRVAAGATGSVGITDDCELLAQRVEAGQTIADAAPATPRVPRLFAYAMQVAAQRNDLVGGLGNLADMYEQHAQQGQASLRSLLLPALIILVGCFMALLVMTMFLPLVMLVDSVSS